METLQLKDIACYLPYRLKASYTHTNKIGEISNVYGLPDNDDIKLSIHWEDGEHMWMFKPILRPISDLYKPLENGTIPILELAKIVGLKFIRYELGDSSVDLYLTDRKNNKYRFWYDDFNKGAFRITATGNGNINQLAGFQFLFKHHFDIFGLIEKGLAIKYEE